jgi:hypothetical protein
MGIFTRDTPRTPEPDRRAKPQPAKAAAYNALRPITASTERIKVKEMQPGSRPWEIWQTDAWVGYERVGEIHYGFNLVGSILSRIRLYAAAMLDPEQAPTSVLEAADKGKIDQDLAKAAQEIMLEFNTSNFSSKVRSFALNMNVAGEVYFMQMPDSGEWVFKSTKEVRVEQNSILYQPLRGGEQKQLPPNTYIARVWREHPEYSREPDSSLMSLTDSIEELLMLQRLVRSATRSRLNAGLLYIPDGITVPSATVADSSAEGEEAEPATVDPGNAFIAELMDSMVTPVSDEGSASSVVPMVVTGPSDLGTSIRHITFERTSDEWLVNRAERSLERILQGIDVPKEMVAGLAAVKYSNAVVIDDNLYKANIEPLALTLSDATTEMYLRPRLKQRGFEDAEINRIVVWYDPSQIVTRPNQSDEVTVGFEHFLVGPKAWRRENGLAETDAPTEQELALMLLASKGVLPPDTTVSLLNVALPGVLKAEREQNIAESPVPMPDSAQQILGG